MAKSTKKATVVETNQRFASTEKNREARLERHIKRNPADEVAKHAVGQPAPVRRKPKTKGSVSKDPVYRVLIHTEDGHKYVPFNHVGASDVPFREPGTSTRDYEQAIRKHRTSLSQVMKETQGKFGKVPEVTEEMIKGNVKALCFGLGIHYTGKSHAPRKPYKGKR